MTKINANFVTIIHKYHEILLLFDESEVFCLIDVTKQRWDLAEMLIQKHKAVIIPLRPKDKIPCIKAWSKKTETTIEELNEWKQKDTNYNLGLVLGINYVAIDVDGIEGDRILQELSGGDIPQTVTYTTPSGGMRYLYRIHSQDKGQVFKKFTKVGEGEHNECALMGVGQQTVLPFCIHPNGGIYEFVDGLSLDDVPIAYVPEWMKALMMKKSSATTFNSISKSKSHASLPISNESLIPYSTPLPTIELKEVFANCVRLQELLQEQITTGLHEEMWFLVTCLLVNNGHISVAREFSRLSPKHSNRSEQRIDQLILAENGASPRCTTLGCTENDIQRCFKTIFKNDNGDTTNSPHRFIQKSKLQNKKIGFYYDRDGNFAGLNGNIFSKFILHNFNIITRDGALFYMYGNNHWKEESEHTLKRMLRKFFNSFEPDEWHEKLHYVYWSNVVLDAKDTSELKKNTNYINVQNGLFNLETMLLENHNSDIFSTAQIPIIYDPSAKCPTFIDFLNDIFQEDIELISLAQEIMGYCLGYSIQAQKIFVLLGEGSNGKSLLCNIIIALCGEKNVSSISLRNLGRQFMKYGLVDKLLNVSTENEMTGDNFNTEDVKAISAGDMIQVERKHKDPYQIRLHVKMMFALNRLPYSHDNSYAITRRLIILPFNKTYVERNAGKGQGSVDLTLEGRLIDELDGILNFALEGLQRLKANNYVFTRAQKSIDVLEDYKLDINPFLDFIQSCVEVVGTEVSDTRDIEDTRIETKVFLRAFREWCTMCNHKRLADTSIRRFLKEVRISLKNLGIAIEEGKSHGKQYFYGIALNEETKKRSNPFFR